MDMSNGKEYSRMYGSNNACDENHVVFTLTLLCNKFGWIITVIIVQISIEKIKAFRRKDYNDEVIEKHTNIYKREK